MVQSQKESLSQNSLDFPPEQRQLFSLLQFLESEAIKSDLFSFAQSLKTESGVPFDFVNHPYLIDIFKDDKPARLVIEKGSQLGLTTFSLIRSIFSCLQGRNVVFFFPTDSGVNDVSRAKVSPLIENNAYLRSQVSSTDSAHLKRIGTGHMFMRGLTSSIQALSVSADELFFDELDEIDPTARQIAEERLSHSAYGRIVEISTPSFPDYGIDRAFLQSDQHHWLIKCAGCSRETNLVSEFPDCIVGDQYQCRCGHVLDRLAGRWVPRFPERKDVRGYHVTQLISPLISPAAIMAKYRNAVSRSEFMRKVIGIPYVESDDRLTLDQVYACCGNEGLQSSSDSPCVMGVDVGRVLHVVLMRDNRVVWLGEVPAFDDLHRFMDRYSITACVVDALPETRMVEAFKARYPRRVFSNYYQDGLKAMNQWDSDKCISKSQRTILHDMVAHKVREGHIGFPRRELCQEFATMLCNLIRVLEEDEETGDRKFVYRKVGADHYRHALGYAMLAGLAPQSYGVMAQVGVGDHRLE